MLRPSRPIMRPFISSLGNATTDTVVSATWSAAQRWIAEEIISFAFFSASSLACCSISLTIIAVSWRISCSTFVNKIFFASSNVMPEIRSNSAICFSYKASTFSRLWAKSASLRCKASSLCSILSNFLSKDSSFWRIRRSIRCNSERRSLFSRSTSERSLWISSFASNKASFFLDSAVRSPFAMMRAASCSAWFSFPSAIFFLKK